MKPPQLDGVQWSLPLGMSPSVTAPCLRFPLLYRFNTACHTTITALLPTCSELYTRGDSDGGAALGVKGATLGAPVTATWLNMGPVSEHSDPYYIAGEKSSVAFL